MAIRFSKYVSILSGVGGAAAVRERELILRLFTANPLVPTDGVVELDTPDDVLAYFGAGSTEYEAALFYFGWVSKNISGAKKISFAFWPEAATAPLVFGTKAARQLAAFQAISDGSFALTMGAETHDVTAIDLTAALSFADVAAAIQTAVRAAGASAVWTGATVAYDAPNQRFTLTGGAVGAAPIAVDVTTTGTDIAGLLGWLAGAILSPGIAAEAPEETLARSADGSNNFGSFAFLADLSDAQVDDVAAWNHAQNVMFMYLVPAADSTEATSLFGRLAALSGAVVTLQNTAGEFAHLVPGVILAATDYNRRNSVQNYMYQQFDLTPSVTENDLSNTLDAVRCNYYGQTQTAGQKIAFYQRGVMMGSLTAPVDCNVYANEQWLKDAAGAALLGLLLALARVSANTRGRGQVLTALQAVIDRALANGTISVGKPLNATQKLFITEVTGSDKAWHQVQAIGYWLDCRMESYVTTDSRTEWKAVYTLVYSKDDAIRKVEGVHTLI